MSASAFSLSWSNWNLEMLVFVEEGNLRSRIKTQSETYCSESESNPGHIGGGNYASLLLNGMVKKWKY